MKNKHLPVFGIGPIYVICCLILTVLGIVFRNIGFLKNGNIYKLQYIVIMAMAGIVLILMGIILWIYAVVVQRISDEIKSGKLVTTGAYAIVRNPIYSAFFLIFTGSLIITSNVYLFILPGVFYFSLTIFLKLTEEKWLLEKFGGDYQRYCKKVNRVIPWWRK
ncbi:methyltransferase family protein [Peptostreptococcus sp. D1]|uniref:methyltransferase family protein n=1 Tax=Peptostreptococcus sp. D1 TaxID=72304 RepID=UPI0008EE7FF8|nr:isoprenylcysteine carboxylmethyltransferase family protein [Peptostreptococcus sp. D1]SFE75480.1 Phospholipid methyltransferase [Peptostreptococcus sp. D1]